MNGHIQFIDSPWPRGHNVVECVFGGHIDRDGLWFDLHLRSDYYIANEKNYNAVKQIKKDKGIDNPWHRKSLWANAHQCTISSTHWPDRPGFLVASKGKKIDFNRLPLFKIDSLNTFKKEKAAMHIYLLGHDTVANHQIQITRTGDELFDIEWLARVALAEDDSAFEYSLEARVKDVPFGGVLIKGEEKESAMKQAARYIKIDDKMGVLRHSPGYMILDLV